MLPCAFMRKTTKRHYSPRTLKLLFGRSGNQCAHPDCNNPVIVGPTGYSGPHVSAQIAHILPVGAKGPRAVAGARNLNEADNLILLCPTCHDIIDGQHETYPAELLREWKAAHEAKVAEIAKRPLGQVQINASGIGVVDIDGETERLELILRRTRFYTDGHMVERATSLGERLLNGDLSGASSQVRSSALGWCARTLVFTDSRSAGQVFLACAQSLVPTESAEIAQAFMQVANGDRAGALERLRRRPTPVSRTAMLMVAAHERKPIEAVEWFESSGFAFTEFDADGKFSLISECLLAERWELLTGFSALLGEQDYAALPVLLHQAALLNFLPSVPPDLRPLVIQQPPFDTSSFPLSSDPHRVAERRVAARLFERSAEAAEALESRNARSVDSFYALWLSLRDPETHADAKRRLQERLREPDTALGFVPLAGAFGISLDTAAVEREIVRRISVSGYHDMEAATARLALAFAQPNPGDAAAYLDQHRVELGEMLDSAAVLGMEIELLVAAGRAEEARTRLQSGETILSAEQQGRLETLIAKQRRDPDIEEAEQAFAAGKGTPALMKLVDALASQPTNPKFLQFARMLFERTRALPDAERLVTLLTSLELQAELEAFFDAEGDLVDHSLALRAARAWQNYRRGRLREAQAEIDLVRAQRTDPNDRMLAINIALTSGAWEEVGSLIEDEWRERDQRTAQQLLWTANLAGLLGLTRKRDFLFIAAESAGNDAQILANAYFMAISFGFDDDPEPVTWLTRAAALSDNDGPIQRVSISEIIERKPSWERQEQDAWEKLRTGELPFFLAGQLLHRSSVDLQLRLMIRNAALADPRRRTAVPLYSGMRQRVSRSVGTITLDATALLTLTYLDVVPLTLDSFERIVLPHSTLTWLLEERGRATFHQPSQLQAAHRLRNYLASGKLSVFTAAAPFDTALADEIGDDLAAMLKAASDGAQESPQRLVVRSSPVRRVGSLVEEDADLSAYRDRFCSCIAIVDKLVARGKLSRAEEARAQAYLSLHEQPRVDEPVVADGAELLLDDLSVSYFDHLRLLDRLADAGFTVRISQREVTGADNLIAYEQVADEVVRIIDKLRAELAKAIEAGRVTVAAQSDGHAEDEDNVRSHPTYGVMSLADEVEAIVIDDRGLNRHGRVDGRQGHAELWDTLDVLDSLRAKGKLGTDEWLELKMRLRQAGAVLVTVSADELALLLPMPALVDGRLAESAELRAIRENMLLIRMGAWLQLPNEAPWFDAFLSAFAHAICACWRVGDLKRAKAQSDWLIQFLDLRDWAGRFEGEARQNIARCGNAMGILSLAKAEDAGDEAQREKLDQFQAWFTKEVLQPLEFHHPAATEWLVERVREIVEALVDEHLPRLMQ